MLDNSYCRKSALFNSINGSFDQRLMSKLQQSVMKRIVDAKLANSLELIRTIGIGTFGKINVIRVKGQASAYALKQIAKTNLMASKRGTESAMTERYILCDLRHPFLMQAYEAWQDARYLYFVMEFASGGDIFSKLQKGELFSEMRICQYVTQIALVLDYLHSRKIIYRDLKAENVLIDDHGHIKLTDFGLSKYCNTEDDHLRAFTFCGTPEYMAPEIIRNDGFGYGQKADWWALGVLMFEMMYGMPPFYDVDTESMLSLVLNENVEFLELPYFSNECRHLVTELLIKDERRRLGNSHIFAHVFLNRLNIDDIYERRYTPEYIPSPEDKFDCSNFDIVSEEYVETASASNILVDIPGFAWLPNGRSRKETL